MPLPLRSAASFSLAVVAVFAPRVGGAQDQSPSTRAYEVRLLGSLFWTEPVVVGDKLGPSPAFVPESSRGDGYGIEMRTRRNTGSSLLVRAVKDRIPLAYGLDAQKSDHPNVDLPFDLQDGNLNRNFNRFSLGLGYARGIPITKRLELDVSATLLYQVASVPAQFHTGVGARNDTSSIWVMGLDVEVAQGLSRWRGALGLGCTYGIGKRHRIGVSVIYERPFSAYFTNGQVILFGLTEYKTTLRFVQSGAIGGVTIAYAYTWYCKPAAGARAPKPLGSR